MKHRNVEHRNRKHRNVMENTGTENTGMWNTGCGVPHSGVFHSGVFCSGVPFNTSVWGAAIFSLCFFFQILPRDSQVVFANSASVPHVAVDTHVRHNQPERQHLLATKGSDVKMLGIAPNFHLERIRSRTTTQSCWQEQCQDSCMRLTFPKLATIQQTNKLAQTAGHSLSAADLSST